MSAVEGNLAAGIPTAGPAVRDAAPPAEEALAPPDLEAAAALLTRATDHRKQVLVWGGGTHQGLGGRVYPDLVLSTESLTGVIAWEPEDLTVVVEAGVRVADLEAMLAGHRQTAALTENPGDATVGGVIAAGVSGYRRARYGPTRDRVLEVTLATGDGRVVRAGGRVVKNVTGYDLPRVAAGSFGRLGLIGSVCLKLWPLPEAAITVPVDDPAAAWMALYRPLAVLETEAGSWAFLSGTLAEVEAQAARVGSGWADGLAWPAAPVGPVVVSVRVPPAGTPDAVSMLPVGSRFVAQHGIGEVTAALPDGMGAGEVAELRAWAEGRGGHVALVEAPDDLYGEVDPWGTPPAGMALQRRLSAQFDPYGVVNRGRLPGGL